MSQLKMEDKEPLLQAYPRSPRPPVVGGSHLSSSTAPLTLLCPLPEEGEITVPLTNHHHHHHPSSPLTPSELKDRLIFGPPPSSPSTTTTTITIDALSLADDPSSASSSSYRLEQQQQQHQQEDDETPTTASTSASSSSWLLDPITNVALPWTKSKWSTNKTNLHRSRTAPAMAAINNLDHHLNPKPPKFASTSIVRQAFLLLLLYLSLGVVIYSFNRKNFSGNETHPVVDALYFCIVTMCTIGYGDITPTTASTKLFSIMFVLIGFGFIDILLSGMVSYVLDLQENLLLTTVKSGSVGVGGARKHDSAKSYFIDVKKGRMRIRIKVGLALGVVILCIGIGTCFMHFMESLGWLDSFYLSVMSVTTVGYGDRAFNSLSGRLFASIWLLVSTLAVARAFLYLAEARIDKRHRMMSKWVLGQDMTVSEFLAADIDNNGFVSKSEYVIYKLKEMGKIMEKDVQQICHQFDRLDTGNCRKITLADLMENHH